jgi:orotate phosphoribosyltransferase
MKQTSNTGAEQFIPLFWNHIHYQKEPFALRAGGESNYFVDAKGFLSSGGVLGKFGRLMLKAAERAGMNNQTVLVASGAGGRALMVAMAVEADLEIIDHNVAEQPDRYPTGLSRLNLEGEHVLLVDDVLTSGSSLSETAELVHKAGGTIIGATVLVDRSDGAATETLHAIGIPKIASLYQFYEGWPATLVET